MSHRRTAAGMGFVELLIAIAIAGLALLVFLSVFGNSARHATQTRNGNAATYLAHSLMDEIEAHPYGDPAPRSWDAGVVTPCEIWVNGRPVQMRFHQRLAFENGSFVGLTNGTSDLVTITLTWKENAGDDQTTDESLPGANKELVVRVPVWR